MPLPERLTRAVRKQIWGTPWGDVFPGRPAPKQTVIDGRDAALGVLKRYIECITFRRSGGKDAKGCTLPPIEFTVPPENVMIDWPDAEKTFTPPTIVMLQEEDGLYESIGLTAYVDEKTMDVYGRGTVVMYMSEYTETFPIEVVASKRSETVAIIKGIEDCLQPTEQMYGIRFTMPDYYGQLVCFTVNKKRLYNEPDVVKGRRRGRLAVEMTYTQVALINYTLTEQPEVRVAVDVNDYNQAIRVTEVATEPDL